jgi:hypothetical protein
MFEAELERSGTCQIALRIAQRRFAQQGGQLGDIHRDPPGLILAEQLGCGSSPRLILIDVSELLAAGVLHDKGRTLNVSADVFDSPRRREAAFCHGVLSHCYAESRAKGIAGMTLCTPPIHIALGFLIAFMDRMNWVAAD